MKRALLALGVLACAGLAVAQTPSLMFGRDSAGKAWPIAVDVVNNQGGVTVSTVPRTCGSPTHSVVSLGTAAANIPTTQLTNRRYLVICVSNAETAAVIVKCRVDGSAPVAGEAGAGDVIRNGDCVTYAIPAATVPQCISDTATSAVTTFECT